MTILILALALSLASAGPREAQSSYAQDDDTRAIHNHRLTVDLVKKTVAVNKGLLALLDTDRAFAKRVEGAKTGGGLDADVKEMESLPQMAALLKTHGISARDYVLTQFAVMSTTLTLQFIEQGNMPAAPPDFPTHNLEFWKANRAALQPIESEWKKTMEALQKREGK